MSIELWPVCIKRLSLMKSGSDSLKVKMSLNYACAKYDKSDHQVNFRY